MPNVIHVQVSDNARCNLRCARVDGVYCARYGPCAAGYLHRVQDWLRRAEGPRTVLREDRKRSYLGGHSTTRIVLGPDADTLVEEVELHCRTLKFESLLKRDVPTATPRAGGPPAPRR